MTPQSLLDYQDHGRLWPHAPGEVDGSNPAAAYEQALAVRRLRMDRGERPAGYKVGFTNRNKMWLPPAPGPMPGAYGPAKHGRRASPPRWDRFQ